MGEYANYALQDEIIKLVLKTQDEQIRQALIDIGWTPPKPQRNRNDIQD